MNLPARRVTVSESVVDAVLGDEAVLLNVQSGIYFGLDAVGARIWELLKEGASEDEINDRLLGEYRVEPRRLREDVAGFMRTLASRDLTREVCG